MSNNNCTIDNDGTKTCYIAIPQYYTDTTTDTADPLFVAAGNDNESAYTNTIGIINGHDIKIACWAILCTILTIATYNCYINCQISANSKRSRKQRSDDDSNSNSNSNSNDNCNGNGNGNGNGDSLMAASLAHMEGMEASGNFLSAVFAQMWNHMNIAVSNTIKDTLEPTLKEMKPVPLHFVRLDLGDVPIKMQNMFIHRVDGVGAEKRTGVQIDVDVLWDGNCDIMLQATMTRGVKVTFGLKKIKLSGRMHILLSPLTTELPVISAVQYGFTNPPKIELEFSGVVHTFTSKFSMVKSALVSVIQSSLADMLVLPNRMVLPMDLGSYDYLDTYHPPVGMVRVSAVEGRGFKVLQKVILKDIPDVYCKISLGASKPFKTSTQYDNVAPCWKDESSDFILCDMDQKIYLEVFDEDKTPVDPDDLLGHAEVTVRDVFQDGGSLEVELLLEGYETGCFITVKADLFHLSDSLVSVDSLKYEGKSQLCGLATIIVTKAFDIPLLKEDAATYVKVVYGEGSEHEKVFYTGTVVDYPGYDALNPMYDSVFHVPLTQAMLHDPSVMAAMMAACGNSSSASSKRRLHALPSFDEASNKIAELKSHMPNPPAGAMNALRSSMKVGAAKSKKENKHNNNITFTLIDTDGANGTSGHGEMGKITITHEDLLRAYKHTLTETRPIGDKGAKLEVRVSMKGFLTEKEQMRGISSPQSSDDPLAPSAPDSLYGGVEVSEGIPIRVTAVRGRGFHISKRRIRKDDVPDVYCTIKVNSSREGAPRAVWKTATIKDDTMPQWNESREFTNIDPSRDIIRVDVFDENRKGKDEYLGSAEITVEKLLRKRMMELELQDESVGTNTHITVRCIELVTAEAKPSQHHLEANGNTALPEDEEDTEEEEDDVVAPLPASIPPLSSHSAGMAKVYDSDEMSVSSTNSTSSTRSKSKRSLNPKKLGRMLSKRVGGVSIRHKKNKNEDGNK